MQSNLTEAERRIEEARRTQAEALDLGDLALSELPASVGDLPHLRRLFLGKNGFDETGKVGWKRDRDDPELSDLTPLSGLVGLESLNLSGCSSVSDLTPLSGLVGLESLNLSGCSSVSDLTPLSGLVGLESLNLSGCSSVSDLTPLSGLVGLERLDLIGCRSVSDLTPLSGLEGLQSLDLRYCGAICSAELLRMFSSRSNLIDLSINEATGVPREILGSHCLSRLRTYFSEVDGEAEAENEVKVILLGNGRVGKTQLCRRFRGEPFDKSIESTHGVQIWREALAIKIGDQEQVFQVNWWDFGGQDIYHGTHALFLRSRAIFLILWTPALENREEYTENGIPLRNQPLVYWLDYVRSLAGEGSPVIVVQSQCDRFQDRRPSPQRLEGFGFFECCSYSAINDLGREVLEAHLREAIRYLLDRSGALQIGRGRAEVRRQLYEWRNRDQERKPEERFHRTLTLDEFRALCDRVGVGGIVSWEYTLDYLHQTGVVFYRPELFSNRIVLDQDWALNAIYTVFHRGRCIPFLRDSGRFTREDLALLVWQNHSVEEQKLFLGLMESCDVCFRCGEAGQGEARYIAPDLLPGFDTVRLHAWNESPDLPVLRLEYRFFHPAIIRSLMKKIGERAGDRAEYWKYGLWLKDGRWDAQALVRFEDTSTEDVPGAGALVLKAQGLDPLGLLREIYEMILWQRIGDKPEELLTLKGATVARHALDTLIDGRFVLDMRRKLVPAADFITFFEGRENMPQEPDDITPVPLGPEDKPREVFISYAWGDDTPEGKTRAETVDKLYTALAEDGFQPVRDRDQIRPGDRISAFIRRLTRTDLVVTVISDKYLRSHYCMYEMYKLWQRCQGDADDLAQRVVPIVLPEVRIGSVAQRVPYLEHWANEADSLEALIRNPSLRPSAESWEEVRLVREFAHHVDDILVFLKDVLMPRELAVHFDDGFQAVREALRRRIA